VRPDKIENGEDTMSEREQSPRELVRHFLAALAYRTQKALRGAPEDFGPFDPGHRIRTPVELVRHMASVLGYARTTFRGGHYRPEPLQTLDDEVERFHGMLRDLSDHLERGDACTVSLRQLLHGPLADAMTHAGQLAMLRRLHGSPIPPEDFIFAEIDVDNLGPDQPAPAAPDAEWPEAPEEDSA